MQGGSAPVDPGQGRASPSLDPTREVRTVPTADQIPASPPARSRSGSETRKKPFLVTSRYDEEEFRELDDAASQAGLSRASYQRVQSLAKPKTRSTRRASIERELLAKTLGQLGKAGSNLNQVARAVNTVGADESEVRAVLAEIREAAQEVMRALGRDT